MGKTLFNVSHVINIKLTKAIIFNREIFRLSWVYPKPLRGLKPSLKQDELLSFEIVHYFTKHHTEEAQFTIRTNKTRHKREMMCGNNFHLKNKTFIKKRNKNRQTRYFIAAIFHTHNSSGDFRLTWARQTAQLPK